MVREGELCSRGKKKTKSERKILVNFISTQKRFSETTAKAKDNCFPA
jgi:hypothetical protein